jgi:hypothetical protein
MVVTDLMRLLPERRRHPRIVTLKNAAWLAGALIVLFIAVSTWNELRTGASSGGLLSRESADAAPATAPRPAAIIEEPPIADRTFAVRGGGANTLEPQAPPPSAPPVAAPESSRRHGTLKEARERGDRIVVSGGPEGVRADAKPVPATATETVVPPDRL